MLDPIRLSQSAADNSYDRSHPVNINTATCRPADSTRASSLFCTHRRSRSNRHTFSARTPYWWWRWRCRIAAIVATYSPSHASAIVSHGTRFAAATIDANFEPTTTTGDTNTCSTAPRTIRTALVLWHSATAARTTIDHRSTESTTDDRTQDFTLHNYSSIDMEGTPEG